MKDFETLTQEFDMACLIMGVASARLDAAIEIGDGAGVKQASKIYGKASSAFMAAMERLGEYDREEWRKLMDDSFIRERRGAA